MSIQKSGISKQILLARQRKGLSKKEVAHALGVSIVHVSDLERGNSYPSLEIFNELTALLDTPADVLLQDEHKNFLVYAIDDYMSRLDHAKANEMLQLLQRMMEKNND